MEIAESIYEDVLEPSYKHLLEQMLTVIVIRKMRGESTSSKTYSETSKHNGKHRQKYVDNPSNQSKPICLINGLGHSSD